MAPGGRMPAGMGLRPGGSLALRLVLVAAVWSAVALAVAGVVLTELYRASIVRSFDARLTVLHKAIAGQLAAAPQGVVPEFGGLGEPRFLVPLTGWYWLVRDARDGTTLTASRSLFGEVLDVPPPPEDGTVRAEFVRGPQNTELRLVVQRLRVGADGRYDVVVTGNSEELADEVSAFRIRVFATLIVFAIGLVVATVLQVRVGLRPLDQMRRSLAAIREGTSTRLDTDLPAEIAPLGQELNALIEANGAIVERARGHVGNLAHALKTPLSVMLNEARADRGPLAAKVIEQADLMRSEVDRYLDRARAAAGRKVVGATADVMRSVDGLAKVLRRAHLDRAVEIETDGPADLRARIERRDLEELVGNLMDNACKFGRGRVKVTVAADPRPAADRPMVSVAVEDDGPGLPEDKYGDVIGRGRRLDETVPGSGLGLSIADEIVETYGGRMTLGRSAMGGLRVAVDLPQS